MKLVIEVDRHGVTHVYREDEGHHEQMQMYRSDVDRKKLAECDKDCVLRPGQHIIVDLKKGQR